MINETRFGTAASILPAMGSNNSSDKLSIAFPETKSNKKKCVSISSYGHS